MHFFLLHVLLLPFIYSTFNFFTHKMTSAHYFVRLSPSSLTVYRSSELSSSLDSYFLLSFFFTLFFFINSHLRVGETAPSSSLETVVRLGRVEDEGLEVKPIIRPDAIHHKDSSAPIGAYVDV